MEQLPQIICGLDAKLTEFKYAVNREDQSVIGLYACPDCGFWYEFPISEFSKKEPAQNA